MESALFSGQSSGPPVFIWPNTVCRSTILPRSPSVCGEAGAAPAGAAAVESADCCAACAWEKPSKSQILSENASPLDEGDFMEGAFSPDRADRADCADWADCASWVSCENDKVDSWPSARRKDSPRPSAALSDGFAKTASPKRALAVAAAKADACVSEAVPETVLETVPKATPEATAGGLLRASPKASLSCAKPPGAEGRATTASWEFFSLAGLAFSPVGADVPFPAAKNSISSLSGAVRCKACRTVREESRMRTWPSTRPALSSRDPWAGMGPSGVNEGAECASEFK